MASILTNNFLEQILKSVIDFDTDTFKIILMASGFVFNRVADAAYADVSADELATLYGYVAGGQALAGVVVAQDDTGNLGTVVWNNASWSISGGDITASGAIIYDDTEATDAVVGYIDFGGDQTCLDGGVASIANIKIQLAG